MYISHIHVYGHGTQTEKQQELENRNKKKEIPVWIFCVNKDSFFISALNNFMRISYREAKIDNKQKNSKCNLFWESCETIYNIICECCKLAQKYNTWIDCVVKVINRDWSKRMNFDYTTKWYM